MNEKELVDQINQSKNKIEHYKQEAERAEREGDYGKVAEIRYGTVQEEEKIMQELSAQLDEMDAQHKR
jgi:ATP-dependent Clp protease ATP-binding subunit ClpB